MIFLRYFELFDQVVDHKMMCLMRDSQHCQKNVHSIQKETRCEFGRHPLHVVIEMLLWQWDATVDRTKYVL